jgi:radical SAM superfamily enzyme YgiQ (UPF0313 family)
MAILESAYMARGIFTMSLNPEAEGYTTTDVIKYINRCKPTKIGLIASGSNPHASTMSMTGCIDLCKAIKKNFNIPVFIYGGHPTVLPNRTLEETGADRVVIGDDYGMHPKDIPSIDYLKLNPYQYRPHNWHVMGQDRKDHYAVLWTSLGCPYSCSFCCINNLFIKHEYRMRNMEDVLNEVDLLVSMGVKHIKIMDELFIIDHPRVAQFCDHIIERKYDLNMWCFGRTDTVKPEILVKLKKAGVNWIGYGFETPNRKVLDSINKKNKSDYGEVIKWTRDAGINIIADVIAGFKEDDYGTLEDLYQFLLLHNFEFINLYPLFGYPGTILYPDIVKSWNEYSIFGRECKPLPTKYLTSAQVLKWRDEHYLKYITRPEYLEMIEKKFGARKEIEEMAKVKIKRDLYD